MLSSVALPSELTKRRSNCVEQTWKYIDSVLSEVAGLKVLLCDDTTRGVLSIGYSQHQLLRHNVVLVDMLENTDRYIMKHFACVILCRPSSRSLAAVYQELAEGNYASYTIFFTYLLQPALLQSLANADVLNLVRRVGEIYVDSIPVSDWVCVAQLKPPPLRGPVAAASTLVNPILPRQWDESSLARMSESIISMMLASNRRPIIRYRANNPVIARLAGEVATRMSNVHALFPEVKARDCVLLLCDRLDDPITPLLMPWTYEAMIGTLIGFRSGNEVLVEDDDTPAEDRVHILTPAADSFFAQHRYDDWGQICLAVGDTVRIYKEMNNFDRDTVSLEEIRNFMYRFPDARRQSAQVTRHCSITSQLVREINQRNLTRLSVIEQDLVSHNNISEHSRVVLELVRDAQNDIHDVLRIVMLYALHYESNSGNIVAQLKDELARRNCSRDRIDMIDRLLENAGQKQRMHQLFKTSTGHILKAATRMVGQFGKEVQNVLTQHTPLMKKLVDRVYNGTLSVEQYEVQEVHGSPVSSAEAPFLRPRDILLVYVGGVTYSELMLLSKFNEGGVGSKQESLIDLGRNVTRRVAGSPESVDVSDESYSPTVQARVSLLSTAVINAEDYITSLSR